MSDDDNKKSGGYRLEYASSGRAKCKGPKPCSGTAIPKGALRLGTQVDFRGNTTFVWRHWGCVTESIIANFKKSFDNADELDGFEELKAVDKERVRTAWTEGKVADEDIPESAKKGSGGEEEEEPKPKKKRAPPKKKAKKDEDDDDDDDDEKPKKKAKKTPAKKAPAKKKAAKKKDSDSEGEDFGEDMDRVSGDEDDDGEDAEAGKKRKRPVPKKAAPSKKATKPASKKSKKKEVSEGEEED